MFYHVHHTKLMYLLILAMLPTPKNEARMKNTCSVVKERPLINSTFITSIESHIGVK